MGTADVKIRRIGIARKEPSMLVLSRQRDETIMIGDDVEITIVDIRGDKVRLGINAPRHIQVHRKEVYEAIKRENQQAAKMEPQDMTKVVEREANAKKGPQPDDAIKQDLPRKDNNELGRLDGIHRPHG
jgi:carbon storage regulator